MIKLVLRLLILSTCVLVFCEGGSGRSSSGRWAGSRGGRSSSAAPARVGDTNGRKKPSSSRSGISALGIIAVVMSVIVGSIVAYYVSICYPILCAKRGKYDVMDMTPV